MPDLNIRDYLMAGAIVALIIGIIVFAVHERGVQAAKDAAYNAKITAAQIVHNAEVEKRASALNTAAMQKYQDSVELPPVGSPHVLVRYLTATEHMPASGTNTAAPAAEAVVAGKDQVDIGPGLDTVGRDDDALITLLQARIASDAQVCGVTK